MTPIVPRIDEDDRRFWQALSAAAAGADADASLRNLYARLDRAVAERNPVCDASGACCRFDSYGHRLYVTGLEIAWFLRHTPAPAAAGDEEEKGGDGLSLPQYAAAGRLPDACVYQISGLCTARATRPLGCRIFFCEPGTEAWQQDLYERFLTELRELHDRLGLPYRYMEWRAGLIEAREATIAPAPATHADGG